MKIEYVLIGVIATVFLIDFLKKKNKNSTSEIIQDSTKPKRKAQLLIKLFFFLIIGLIIGVFIDFYINSDIYLYSKDDPSGNFNKNDFLWLIKDRISDESGLLNLTSGVAISAGIFFLFSSRIKIISYVVKRKKNLTLSIILIPLLKVLMHYFLYPERTRSSRNSPTRIKSFGDHINMIFDEHLELFIPSLFLVLFFAWFLNDKIKAK